MKLYTIIAAGILACSVGYGCINDAPSKKELKELELQVEGAHQEVQETIKGVKELTQRVERMERVSAKQKVSRYYFDQEILEDTCKTQRWLEAHNLYNEPKDYCAELVQFNSKHPKDYKPN